MQDLVCLQGVGAFTSSHLQYVHPRKGSRRPALQGLQMQTAPHHRQGCRRRRAGPKPQVQA